MNDKFKKYFAKNKKKDLVFLKEKIDKRSHRFCIEIYSVFPLSKNKSLYENNPHYVNFVLDFGFYHNYQIIK